MDRTRNAPSRHARLLPWLCLVALVGCQSVKTPEEVVAKTDQPRELQKMSLPEYVVEPPDIIRVEVLEALPGRTITGERLVRSDGTISLEYYGDVYVAGLTLTQVKEKIIIHLRKFLTDQALGLVEAVNDASGNPTSELKPVPLAKNDRVFVDVLVYNSKVYYVDGDVGLAGRFPSQGNETVLDAIYNAGGLSPSASVSNIRLVRPGPPGTSVAQVLPVNYAAIVQAGDPTTNYQILPGDRLFVYRDPIVRTTLFIDRLAAPFNSVLNSILTYSFTARNVKSINVPINGTNTNSTTTGRGVNTVSPTTPAR